MARRAEDLAPLAAEPAWKPLRADGGPVWTDDFSNVLAAVQWQFSADWLPSSAWWMSAADEADFHFKLGNTFAGRGEVDKAIAHYRKALEIKPDYAEAHNDLGLPSWPAGDGSTRPSPITARPWKSSPTSRRPTTTSGFWPAADRSTRPSSSTARPWKSGPTMPRPTSTSAVLAGRGTDRRGHRPVPKGPGTGRATRQAGVGPVQSNRDSVL